VATIYNRGNGMVMIRGYLEILQMADSNGPMHFNDFTKISIKGRKVSSATVSKRLDELILVKVIGEVISRSKTGRRIIAYKTTEKGRKVLKLAEELKEQTAVPSAKGYMVK
jgi:DNA-binding HxlR family transcriptional regulator